MSNVKPVNSGLLANDVLLVRVLLDYVNSWADKPVQISLEVTDKEPPAMMMQIQGNTIPVKEYIDGSYIGQLPFIMYIRIDGNDTASKLDAYETMDNFYKWLQENESNKTVPYLNSKDKYQKIEMTSSTTMSAQYDNGYEDYSAVFILTYQHLNINI